MGYVGQRKRDYQILWMKARRDEWLLQNGPCVDCSSWERLEVDHVDPAKKLRHISTIWSLCKEKREAELVKCVVRCYWCHKKKTSAERKLLYKHGTLGCWKCMPCRCLDCVMAHRSYKREYRARGGAH
jgi:hypothetical protein